MLHTGSGASWPPSGVSLAFCRPKIDIVKLAGILIYGPVQFS